MARSKGGFLMFSNFRDTFIKKPQYTSAPPQAVIDSISQELPKSPLAFICKILEN